MNKLLSLTVVALLGLTGAAHAATVGVYLGNTSSDVSYGPVVTFAPNVDLASAVTGGSLTLTNSAFVISPVTSVSGQYAQPTGSNYHDAYVAVLGTVPASSATFTTNQNTFSFTWGTIDAYNTLVLTDSRNVQYTITGTDILNQIAGNVPGTTQADVSFTDTFAKIVSAQLLSTQNSFEATNFETTTAAVPLPPALSLFAAALLGLGLYSMRNRKAA